MNKPLVFLAMLLFALGACSNEGDHGHAHEGNSDHQHTEGSQHEPHADDSPQTQSYYADGEGQADTSEKKPDSEHSHDSEHGHSH